MFHARRLAEPEREPAAGEARPRHVAGRGRAPAGGAGGGGGDARRRRPPARRPAGGRRDDARRRRRRAATRGGHARRQADRHADGVRHGAAEVGGGGGAEGWGLRHGGDRNR